jgi:hypothetical protein
MVKREESPSYFPAASRTELEVLFYRTMAKRACSVFWFLGMDHAGSRIRPGMAAMSAFEKEGPFFNGNQGNEKKGQAVIYSFLSGLIKTTGRAHGRLIAQYPGPGLNTCNKEHHESSIALNEPFCQWGISF